jgi:hypothetical protein
MDGSFRGSKYDNAINVCQRYGELDEDKKLRLAGKNLNKEYEKWLALAVEQTTFYEMQTGHFLLKYFKIDIEKADKIADKLLTMHIKNADRYLIEYEKNKNVIIDKGGPIITPIYGKEIDYKNEIIFCRKCGTKLPKDSVFCKTAALRYYKKQIGREKEESEEKICFCYFICYFAFDIC